MRLRVAGFFDNTPPVDFLLLSSADSPALTMSPRLIVTVVRHLPAQGARIAHHPLSKLRARQEAQNVPQEVMTSTLFLGLSRRS